MDNKHAVNKEADILRAAEQEFLAKGFAGARTTSIASAAGVTHAMLHYYFHTKEQLFNRILDEKMSLMGKLFLASFGDGRLPLMERLRKGIGDHFDFIAANPGLPRFIINEVFAHPERYEAMRVRVEAILSAILADLQGEIDRAAARGEVVAVDVRMLLLDIVSLNLFVFIVSPLAEWVFGCEGEEGREQFLAARKAEHIETILRRLKK